MLTYKGRYGTAYVMLDTIEQSTVSQIYEFLNHIAFTNHIAIMPDTHKGEGSVIGFTMPMHHEMVIPNIVGVDINCGMFMLIFKEGTFPDYLQLEQRLKIDELIRQSIPFGEKVHQGPVIIEEGFWSAVSREHRLFVMKFNKKYGTSYAPVEFNFEWFQNKCEQIGMDLERAVQSIGTLGGGNHFIELGQSVNSKKHAMTIHTGSRQFGFKICKYWQRKAGKGALAYLTGEDMFGYLSDTIFAQFYASLNRHHISERILSALDLSWNNVYDSIRTNHNFIDFSDFVIRKGAIRSYTGERMVIPFNMQDGILVCEGKSNPFWNFSAPHGAGRFDSRKWAKQNLNIDEARKGMEQNDICCTKLPIDEAKAAYKDPKIIEDSIGETATILDRFKPVLAMKD